MFNPSFLHFPSFLVKVEKMAENSEYFQTDAFLYQQIALFLSTSDLSSVIIIFKDTVASAKIE